MDLNDPRRRLQVARTASPSLRMAAAPKQQLKISMARPQQLSVAQPAQPQLRMAQPYTAPLNVAQAPMPNVGPMRLAQKVQGAPAPPPSQQKRGWTSIAGVFKPISEGGINAFADAGNFVKDIFVKPTVDSAVDAWNQGRASISVQQKGGRGPDLTKLKEMYAQDLREGKISQAQYNELAGKIDKRNNTNRKAIKDTEKELGFKYDPDRGAIATLETAANVTGVGALVKGLTVGTLKAGGTAVQKVANLIKPKEGANIVTDVIKETDPAVIKQALGVDDDIAVYLSQETNKEAVKEVLREIAVDPNIQISDALRGRLQKDGITAVNKKGTPYGAEYDPNTAAINVRDQSFATDENLYHELGHHIFKTQLTPEERALFAKVNGPARNQAKGRKGYTEDDLVSEDFSDMMRKYLAGEDVPVELRPVLQKYAGEVQRNIETAKLPTGDIEAIKEAGGNLPAVSNKAFDQVELPKTAEATPIDEVVPNKPVESPELNKLPEEDVAAIKEAGGTLPEKIAAEAEAVGKAQTGTADGLVDETSTAAVKSADGATEVAPEKGIKFRDPVTKKQVIRKVEDVQDELDQLKNLPEEKVDAKVKARIKTLEKKIYGYRSDDAKFSFPDAPPEIQTEIQKVMDELRGAERRYNVAEKAKTKEKGARIGAGKANYAEAGGGEAGFQAKLGSLKGKYEKSTFEPIAADAKTQATILDDIENSNLRDFEKLNTQNAMRKIWGANEDKPTKSDINYIRKYFGDEMADAVDEAVEEGGKSWKERLIDVAGLPRAAMASFDFSMGLRQGGQVAVRHFPTWVRANKESVKYAGKPKYFEQEMKKMADDDHYETITDMMNVRLPAVQGASDEIMASAHMLEKIPVYGRGIEASDRAYSGGLSKLRFDLAKQWIDNLGGIDEVTKNLSKKELQDLGEVINTSTGSGGAKNGFTEKHMETLATTLFAPRLWASRLNSINPRYYQRLSPEARKMAVQNMASFLAAATSVAGLAKAAGADVEADPRSSDFMKIKLGNTRMDIFGGLQQNIVFAARMITGEKKNSTNGEIATLGDGFGAPDRVDLGIDMLTNKLNPLLGYLSRVLRSSDNPDSDNPVDRKDRFGEDMNAAGEAANLGIPLGVQGFVDTMNETGGDVAKSTALNAASFFGVGVQTYGESKNGSKSSEVQSTGDRVKDAQAKAEKIRADAKESRESAVKLLSEDDRVIYEIGKADKNALSSEEKTKFERINKWVGDYKQDIETPDGLTSNAAKNVYRKYNSMTKPDKEAWLKGKADQTGKDIASTLSKSRAKGLDPYKPSNALSKLYSDYEKDVNTKKYSEVERSQRDKEFQKAAYKLNFGEKAKEYYSIASQSITTIRNAIENGKITQKDLEEAIKLDNDLFNSGLNGSLQFSKKFRREHGFGVPSGSGGSGGKGGRGRGGGGGSGSTASKRAYLSELMPSKTGSEQPAAPKFSAKRRTTGISFKNVKKPTKSNSKKVTINL